MTSVQALMEPFLFTNRAALAQEQGGLAQRLCARGVTRAKLLVHMLGLWSATAVWAWLVATPPADLAIVVLIALLFLFAPCPFL